MADKRASLFRRAFCANTIKSIFLSQHRLSLFIRHPVIDVCYAKLLGKRGTNELHCIRSVEKCDGVMRPCAAQVFAKNLSQKLLTSPALISRTAHTDILPSHVNIPRAVMKERKNGKR